MIFYKRLIPVCVLALTLSSSTASADLVTFDFRGTNGTFDFNATSGSHTHTASGITMNFTAFVNDLESLGSTLNATADSLGINASGAGDDTDQIDNDLGFERIRIEFVIPGTALPVTLVSFETVGYATGDGTYDINDGTPINLDTDDDTAVNALLTSGSTIDFLAADNDGFGLTTLTLDFTAIPEPTSMMLFGTAMAFCSRRRKR